MKNFLTKYGPFLVVALVGTFISFGSIVYADRTAVSVPGTYPISVACVTGTSTIFAVQNPLNATTTLLWPTLSGFNGATSTDILIATSTTPSPAGLAVATSSLNENILGMFNIPANSQFYSVAGVTMGPGTGYNNSAGGTYRSNATIVLGPREWLLGFSTSTNPSGNGGLAAGSLGLPTSCTFKGLLVQ